jgi:hypothetical protein
LRIKVRGCSSAAYRCDGRTIIVHPNPPHLFLVKALRALSSGGSCRWLRGEGEGCCRWQGVRRNAEHMIGLCSACQRRGCCRSLCCGVPDKHDLRGIGRVDRHVVSGRRPCTRARASREVRAPCRNAPGTFEDLAVRAVCKRGDNTARRLQDAVPLPIFAVPET